MKYSHSNSCVVPVIWDGSTCLRTLLLHVDDLVCQKIQFRRQEFYFSYVYMFMSVCVRAQECSSKRGQERSSDLNLKFTGVVLRTKLRSSVLTLATELTPLTLKINFK